MDWAKSWFRPDQEIGTGSMTPDRVAETARTNTAVGSSQITGAEYDAATEDLSITIKGKMSLKNAEDIQSKALVDYSNNTSGLSSP